MQQIPLSKLDSKYVTDLSLSQLEPQWLQEYRKDSIRKYAELPDEISPLYNKYSDANKMAHDQIYLYKDSVIRIPDFIKNR